MLVAALAPWIVGREPLLEYAIDDYLRELGRARPWVGKTHEAILTQLNADLDEQHGLTPLRVVQEGALDRWLETQSDPAAREVIADFVSYLLEWNWLQA